MTAGFRPSRHARVTVALAVALALLGSAAADAAPSRDRGDDGRAAHRGSAHSVVSRALLPPTSPFVVTRLASIPHPNWLAGHRGVDLKAAVGDDVYSPASGVVSFAGDVAGRPVVSVRISESLVASFDAVSTSLSQGDTVARGDVLGTVAASAHCGSTPCVHWGLRRDGVYVDPLDYVEGYGEIRLLPVQAT